MHVYLIRHGQSYVNLEEWANGNTDEGLTPLGRRQAAALARWMPAEIPQVDLLYASTMRRARETAGYLAEAYGCEPIYDDRLREIGNNRLDHTPFPNDKLPRDYAEYWSSERPFSPVTPMAAGGETYIHFRARVGLFIEELIEDHYDPALLPGAPNGPEKAPVILVVCHGGVVEAFFDHVFNIGPWRQCEIWDRNTAVTHFQYVAHPQRETWRLHYHNAVLHWQYLEDAPEEAAVDSRRILKR